MTPKAKYSLTGKNLNSYQNSFEMLIKRPDEVEEGRIPGGPPLRRPGPVRAASREI